jgi:hypothetical protein
MPAASQRHATPEISTTSAFQALVLSEVRGRGSCMTGQLSLATRGDPVLVVSLRSTLGAR